MPRTLQDLSGGTCFVPANANEHRPNSAKAECLRWQVSSSNLTDSNTEVALQDLQMLLAWKLIRVINRTETDNTLGQCDSAKRSVPPKLELLATQVCFQVFHSGDPECFFRLAHLLDSQIGL